MSLTGGLSLPQTRSGVVGESTLRAVTIRTSFALDDGSMAPNVLRETAGWKFERAGDVVVAEHRTGRYEIPLSNIPGMSSPKRMPPPVAPGSEHPVTTPAIKQAADEAATRSRGRPGRR